MLLGTAIDFLMSFGLLGLLRLFLLITVLLLLTTLRLRDISVDIVVVVVCVLGPNVTGVEFKLTMVTPPEVLLPSTFTSDDAESFC